MAECHPVGFQWVMEAKDRGATIIHVDPRFTRTSAMADLHVPLRAGSDIAFLGGIIRYILENDRAFREYIIPYTNAANIVSEEFKDTEDLDGLFSGWDAKTGEYESRSWRYEGAEGEIPAAGHKEAVPQGGQLLRIDGARGCPDERPLARPGRGKALAFEVTVGLEHGVRVDRQGGDDVLDPRKLVTAAQVPQPQRVLDLMYQLQVGRDARAWVKPEHQRRHRRLLTTRTLLLIYLHS